MLSLRGNVFLLFMFWGRSVELAFYAPDPGGDIFDLSEKNLN